MVINMTNLVMQRIVNDVDYHSKVIVENNVDETKLGEYEVNYF